MRDGNNRQVLFVGDVSAKKETSPLLDALESDHDVTTVATAADAINRLEENETTFDCVVCEHQLRDADGLSLLEDVRETADEIPFILERGSGDEAVVEEAIAEGVTDFYLPPGTSAGGRALKTRVETAIETARRKERERRLRRYEEAVEHSGHAVFITDREGTIEYVNPAFEEITGFDAEDALGETPSLLASGEMSEAFFDDLWETILDAETWEGEIVNRRADGELYYAEQTIAPILDDGEPTAFVAVQQDVTERRKRERELDRARKKLRAIIDLIPDPVFLKNRNGQYLLANEAIADVYGATPATVEGNTDAELDIPPETARRFAEEDRTVIESGQTVETDEDRLQTADGDERVFETVKIPYELESVGETAVLGYARDVTDLKEREKALESQRDDLDVLNQMVRHDIRNDIQLVRSYAELLEEHVEGEPADYLDIVEERTDRAIELTQTARELAAVLLHEETDPRGMTLDEPIVEQVEALRSSFPEANIEIDSPISDTRVVADELAEAIVRNLVQNAVYHNDKQTPFVSVSTKERSGAVRLMVADNGPGIDDVHKAEIFGQGEKGLESDGTGIGLYLVKTLVDRYDGDVWVEDNDPEGSVFVVEFPKADRETDK
ncbi:MAG: PAS domain S-box protein [Halanaeroarchaeum sp.]